MKAAVFRSISRPVFSVKINVWKSWHFREGCHVVPTIRVGDAINISMCGKRMRYIRSKHFSALYWKRKIWNGLKFERKKKIPKPNWSFWNNQMKQQMSEDNEKQTAKTQNKPKYQKTARNTTYFYSNNVGKTKRRCLITMKNNNQKPNLFCTNNGTTIRSSRCLKTMDGTTKWSLQLSEDYEGMWMKQGST